MKLDWILIPETEREAFAESLVNEGEKQGVIDVVRNFAKPLYSAFLPTLEHLRAVVIHDLSGRLDNKRSILLPDGKPRTLGHFWDRMKANNYQFEGDWLRDCFPIMQNFDKNRLRIFVGGKREDKLADWGGEYLITDGAHRALVAMRKYDEGLIYTPCPVFSTEVNL